MQLGRPSQTAIYVKYSCISALLSRSLRYIWKLCHICWILDKIAFKLILINSTESYIYTLATLVRKLLLIHYINMSFLIPLCSHKYRDWGYQDYLLIFIQRLILRWEVSPKLNQKCVLPFQDRFLIKYLDTD